MAYRNIISGALLIAVGVWYAWQTLQLPLRTGVMPNTPGPSFFPWVIVTVLLALAAALLIQGVSGLATSASTSTSKTAHKPASWQSPGKSFALLAIILIYIAALPYLGFIAASTGAFPILMILFGARNWLVIVPMSVIVPAAFFGFFTYVFNVILPRGLIAF